MLGPRADCAGRVRRVWRVFLFQPSGCKNDTPKHQKSKCESPKCEFPAYLIELSGDPFGVRSSWRLTRIDTGEGRHLGLLDDGLFDYPWVYATQVGYWDLSRAETARLREYLRRGGFLVVDDFYGLRDWEVFRATMQDVFPEQTILDLRDDDALFSVLYQIHERTFIPGLRHLRRGPGGTVLAQPQGMPPTWRALYDAKGRLVVAINFNMDIGDAWEHADLPEYPADMTMLAYRFGLNYILYSMTH